MAVVSALVFAKLHFRKDSAPDFLYELGGRYFDRRGFCFTPKIVVEDQVALLSVFFQNRFERRCIGGCILQHEVGAFSRGAVLPAILFNTECPPGGFGVVRIPLGIAQELQGKRIRFRLGGMAKFPDGTGRMLRFRNAVPLRTSVVDFMKGRSDADAFKTIAIVTGIPVLSTKECVDVDIPRGVLEKVSQPTELVPQILWQLGDSCSADSIQDVLNRARA